jgi:hypothetical protein
MPPWDLASLPKADLHVHLEGPLASRWRRTSAWCARSSSRSYGTRVLRNTVSSMIRRAGANQWVMRTASRCK